MRPSIARAAVSLATIALAADSSALLWQGVENPSDEELLGTSRLIVAPVLFMDTFTVNDPHMEGIATTLAGKAGDSVTIYAGSLTLDLLIALSDSTGNELELFDDDSGPGANATIDAELPSDGRYFFMVMPSVDNEGWGAVVDRTDVTGEWTAIPLGSVIEALFEVLCGN